MVLANGGDLVIKRRFGGKDVYETSDFTQSMVTIMIDVMK
jgi:hypothetical protein